MKLYISFLVCCLTVATGCANKDPSTIFKADKNANQKITLRVVEPGAVMVRDRDPDAAGLWGGILAGPIGAAVASAVAGREDGVKDGVPFTELRDSFGFEAEWFKDTLSAFSSATTESNLILEKLAPNKQVVEPMAYADVDDVVVTIEHMFTIPLDRSKLRFEAKIMIFEPQRQRELYDDPSTKEDESAPKIPNASKVFNFVYESPELDSGYSFEKAGIDITAESTMQDQKVITEVREKITTTNQASWFANDGELFKYHLEQAMWGYRATLEKGVFGKDNFKQSKQRSTAHYSEHESLASMKKVIDRNPDSGLTLVLWSNGKVETVRDDNS